MFLLQALLPAICIPFLILVLYSREVLLAKTRRFNNQVGFRKDYCPEMCKLTLETPSCADVSNLRQTPDLTEVCSTFLSNKFSSPADCTEKCSGCSIRKILQPCTTQKLEARFAICKLVPKPGPCPGYFASWYYDYEYGDCRQFVYGGCGGNDNRFTDHLPCLSRCGLLGVLYPPAKRLRELEHLEL